MSDGQPFKDHFSGHAGDYARYRPEYPEALFDYLAGLAPGRRRAWDCGTGNGQAARALAARFREVVASDASAEQIDRARGPDNVRFQVCPAEDSGLAAASVELITVAQAFHWFDQPRFFAETCRVLCPGGILALWSYGLMRIAPAVDRILADYYHRVVGPYWPPERAQVEAGYADVALPFPELTPPAFEMHAEWTLEQVAGYLRTWSASRRYLSAHGTDPLIPLIPALRTAWGPETAVRQVRWPLNLRVGRRPHIGED